MVRCCVLGRVLGGWVWRWCLVVECWVGCWVAKRMGAFGVFSVWIGVGVFLKACFLVWALRIVSCMIQWTTRNLNHIALSGCS